jgi:DNA-binding response OmpR family regulator
MSGKPRILVVEDEESIRVGICDVLAFKGFEPHGVADGSAGLEHALAGGWDLLLLDVMLPGVDGFTICRKARAADPRQAILMLTARGDEGSVLEGFSAGADDYVSKPFSLAQLMARIQALVRRAATASEDSFAVGPVEIDTGRLTATAGDASVELSPRDVEVLTMLVREEGRVVSRAELLREVWGYSRPDALETRCVDMHIAKLRRKLKPVSPTIIETVRGAGYRVRD